MNHKELTTLIKKISGQANFIGAPRIYVDIFDGDLNAAVWLNQVVYWDGKNDEPIGFYKTYAEWKKEIGLSEYQVRRVAKECERRGLVNITFRKVYGTPKNHYLVVWPELLKVIQETLENSDPLETKGSEPLETQGSEGEESQGSREGEETTPSLDKEETTTKTTDAFSTLLEFERIAHENRDKAWEGREVFLQDDLPLVDWYHRVTGQVCKKSKRRSWMKAVKDWKSNGLAVDDLQAAYDADISWRKVFTDPNQLTEKAIALRAQKQVIQEREHEEVPESVLEARRRLEMSNEYN